MSDELDDWIYPKECAALIGYSVRGLRFLHKRGCGPPHYVQTDGTRGRAVAKRRYRRSQVREWLALQRKDD